MLYRNCQNPLPWPLCEPQAGLVVPKAPSQGLKLLILTSFSPHLDLSFSVEKLLWHYRQCIFDLQSSSHSSLNKFCCPYIKHQSTLLALMFIIHCSQSAITFHPLVCGRCFKVSAYKSPQHTYLQSRHETETSTNWLSNKTISEVIMLRLSRWMHDALGLFVQVQETHVRTIKAWNSN